MSVSNLTDFQAKYFAYELTKRCASDSLEKLSSTLSNAQVDLNPHQIDAALFAFKSPLSKGAILADEVGLGKTIEAGLVLSQKWAERKRNILLIVPSNLRKQWSTELQEKFFLPSIILEKKSFNEIIKSGNLNPLNQDNKIIICSYHFAKDKDSYIKKTPFDLVVIDEAHRLRNVYKTTNKIGRVIKEAIQDYPKILLTATPLQNSLLELYGLTSIIDDYIFGDLKSFKANYAKVSKIQESGSEIEQIEPNYDKFKDLKERLKPICKRTLRKQVSEYINFKERKAITRGYFPADDEINLYNGITEYLQRENLYALPASQRQLMTLILRKLLASSSRAISSTLNGQIKKLEKVLEQLKKDTEISEFDTLFGLEENYEALADTADDWIDGDEDEDESKNRISNLSAEDIPYLEKEIQDLQNYRELADKITTNSKGTSLLMAINKGFTKQEELAQMQKISTPSRKAIIFTESRITQQYLWELLSDNGYSGKILLFNGTNTDPKSVEIYNKWYKNNKDTDKITGSKTADLRSALVDYFKDEAEIMIATEAASEGINLQFCSLVINYDLPWNPQRIEQRIGRCHRYGQKHDVVVVNFVNENNAADKRVYELLDQKFKLFEGIFGASDEVLGAIESGVDFEKRIASIYQSCRTEDQINKAFDELQDQMSQSIQAGLKGAKETLLENFDVDVHDKLRMRLNDSKAYLEQYENWLWQITQYYLGSKGEFSDSDHSFKLLSNPFPNQNIESGPYRIGKQIEDAHIYRTGHPLAELILNQVKNIQLTNSNIEFDYSNFGQLISPIKNLVGKSGLFKVSQLTIDTLESEDHIILTAIDENGDQIDHEICKNFFKLGWKTITPYIEIDKNSLERLEQNSIIDISAHIDQKNAVFYDEEDEKLEKWAEDVKTSLEIQLKQMDIDLKSMKTSAKKVLNLSEKLTLKKEIVDLEMKRNLMRQKLFVSQDEIGKKKEELIDKVRARLNQNSTLTELFTIKFNVV